MFFSFLLSIFFHLLRYFFLIPIISFIPSFYFLRSNSDYAKEKHFSEAIEGIHSLSGFDSMTGQDAEWTVALQDLVSRALDGTLPEGTAEFREEFFSTLDIELDTTAASKGNRAAASVALVASITSVGSNKKK